MVVDDFLDANRNPLAQNSEGFLYACQGKSFNRVKGSGHVYQRLGRVDNIFCFGRVNVVETVANVLFSNDI
jgi:hypothetical protein